VFQNVTEARFVFLNVSPSGGILGATAAVLIFSVLVTSADSRTFVLSMITTDGNLNPPGVHKMVWGILSAILTIRTLHSGSVAVAKAMSITRALRFSVVLLLQFVGFLHAIRHDLKQTTGPIERRGEVFSGEAEWACLDTPADQLTIGVEEEFLIRPLLEAVGAVGQTRQMFGQRAARDVTHRLLKCP
jgi:choline-glycine betaine transporter